MTKEQEKKKKTQKAGQQQRRHWVVLGEENTVAKRPTNIVSRTRKMGIREKKRGGKPKEGWPHSPGDVTEGIKARKRRRKHVREDQKSIQKENPESNVKKVEKKE